MSALSLHRLTQRLPWSHCHRTGYMFKSTSRAIVPMPKVGPLLPGVNDCDNNNCLCTNRVEIDYKNARFLSQFTSPVTGNILPRTLTRVCRLAQWKIGKSIKKARCAGLMPIIGKHPEYARDPPLFY
ncbi:small ribosomal subunit protein bS18m-like [Dysidea avara]|uniref:small ribosomal subunit protein bS18m-like n=1 Tax=Dysidea avara TaxID=196820 RepID=UPI003316F73E